jgi:hypothetical protein
MNEGVCEIKELAAHQATCHICERCGRYSWGECSCVPYEIHADGEETPTIIYGDTFTEVVEKFAKQYNESGDPLCNDNVFEAPIKVVNNLGEALWFNVYVEAELVYVASQTDECFEGAML